MRLFLRVRKTGWLMGMLLVGWMVIPACGQQEGQPRPQRSQIIDDSTKQIYGPTTSTYFLERDVFYNNKVRYTIDTNIVNFHRYTYVQRYAHRYQDLGNIGTAARPVFYQVPEQIGVTSGIDVYDVYWESPAIRYFDTKSPYSNLKILLGARGRSVTGVTYARNINPRWSFGFDYRGLFIDKQVQREGKGDRHVRSNYYDLFTAYQSRDSAYNLFINFARNRHQVAEYGGVLVEDPYNYDTDEFFLQNIRPQLNEAQARELRINYHLFHQYRVGSALQVYHTFDRYRQGNIFTDVPASEPDDYYPYIEIDSAQTYDETRFVTLRNEVGVKGNLLKLFYNGYYAIRNYNMGYNNIMEDTLGISTRGVENYLGGRMALQLDSLMTLHGWAEVVDNGNYRLEASLTSKWLDASLKQNKYAPGFMQQAYRGSFNVWTNDFSPVDVTQITGFLHYRSRILHLSPGMTFTRLNNYVYFDQDTSRLQPVLPRQARGNHIMFAPEVRFRLTMARHIHFSGNAIYTSLIENAGNAMQVPSLFVNAQLAYHNIFFNGNLDLHTGVDFHWQSTYDGYGYSPSIQQYYVQDERIRFPLPSYPVVDIFLNAKIKRGRIFLKFHNFLQMITGDGYFTAPYYPAQANVIDFGFDWSFYD